jgi:hypothetical protein
VPDRILAGAPLDVGAPVTTRRKLTDEANLLLLMEVSARKAHVSVFGKTMDTFSDISEALRCKLPWETDAKHCKDRYTLLTRTFKKNDNIGRSSVGVEEEFGEKETHLTSLTE